MVGVGVAVAVVHRTARDCAALNAAMRMDRGSAWSLLEVPLGSGSHWPQRCTGGQRPVRGDSCVEYFFGGVDVSVDGVDHRVGPAPPKIPFAASGRSIVWHRWRLQRNTSPSGLLPTSWQVGFLAGLGTIRFASSAVAR